MDWRGMRPSDNVEDPERDWRWRAWNLSRDLGLRPALPPVQSGPPEPPSMGLLADAIERARGQSMRERGGTGDTLHESAILGLPFPDAMRSTTMNYPYDLGQLARMRGGPFMPQMGQAPQQAPPTTAAGGGVPDMLTARGQGAQGLQRAQAAPGQAATAPGMTQAMANNPVDTTAQMPARGVGPGAAVGQLGDEDALRRLQMLRQFSAMGGLGQIARTRYGP